MKKLFADKSLVSKIIVFGILLLAFVLRFYKLDSYPALNADEASIGYNAYSLLATGKDEHLNSWPIHFQSFNDYKPGLYFYLVMPFVKVLGLSELAVRIPGAFMGFLSVLILFLLVKELKLGKYTSYLSALFLTISPWHIHFSRGGWEVNAASFVILMGLYFLIKTVKNDLNWKYYLLSIFFLVLSLYTYHAARIISPLLFLGVFVVYRKKFLKNAAKVGLFSLFGILLLIPLILDFSKGTVYSRAAGVGLFADSGPLNRINEQRGEHDNFKSAYSRILHNKAVNYSLAFFENYLKHFHGEFLFLSGDEIQRNKVPETGQMYIYDFIFLVFGSVFILRKINKKRIVLLIWLFIAPIASSLTFQSPNALRSHNMIFPLIIISAYGLNKIFYLLRKKGQLFLVVGSCVILFSITFFFVRYLHMYWVHMAKEYPYSSQYGFKEMIQKVTLIEKEYKNIYITNRFDQPYILTLFYLKYPIENFQYNHALTSKDKYGFSTVSEFDKYHFEGIVFDELKPQVTNSIIVGTDEEIPDEANIVDKVYFPSGDVAFKIVAN